MRDGQRDDGDVAYGNGYDNGFSEGAYDAGYDHGYDDGYAQHGYPSDNGYSSVDQDDYSPYQSDSPGDD